MSNVVTHVSLVKLMCIQLIMILVVALITEVHHWALSWVGSIYYLPWRPISLTYILMYPPAIPWSSNWPFCFRLSNRFFIFTFISSVYALCPTHLIHFHWNLGAVLYKITIYETSCVIFCIYVLLCPVPKHSLESFVFSTRRVLYYKYFVLSHLFYTNFTTLTSYLNLV